MGQVPPPDVEVRVPAPAPPPKKNSVTSLLQPNSLLTGVMLPRYDENRRLSGLFRAKTVTLVTQEMLDGETITMEQFNPDRSPSGLVEMDKARYDQIKGTVRGTGVTKLAKDNITATGTALVFYIDRAEGFLSGPAVTRIKPQPETTAMRPVPATLRATALLSASVPTLLIANPTSPAAVPAAPTAQVAAANAETRSHLRAALTASASATAAATQFLDAEDLLAATAAAPAAGREPMALNIKPGPEDTVINCDGGMYFDGKAGTLVFMANVTVDDPQLSMDGANDVQVFFEKKPPPEPATAKDDPKNKAAATGIGADLGKIERIVATGAIHLLQKPKPDAKELPIEASGAVFTYHFKSREIILSGGKPWVRQGGIINRAKKADQFIRIIDNTATFSPGGTETILPVEQMQKKSK
jgi:lipopolysaccharide export system protein LptA